MNPYIVVDEFERMVAHYAGAPYAVAVDSCSNALFLCCLYLGVKRAPDKVIIPARTYCSVPMAVHNAGGKFRFIDYDWSGVYTLMPFPIHDGAKRFTSGMYQGGFHCLSFHQKKILNIGRGGMILTDSKAAYDWFRRARYDGRDGVPYNDEKVTMMGFNMYMTPDQAIRGIQILNALPEKNEDLTEDYPDLREMPVFKK